MRNFLLQPGDFVLSAALLLLPAAPGFSDDFARQLLPEFGASCQARNTVVVLPEDNGFHFGESGQRVNNISTELTTRVPLLLRSPGHIPHALYITPKP